MNKLNASVLPLVGLSVVLSLSAVIAVAAHWPDRSGTMPMTARQVVQRATPTQNVRIVMHDPGCHWFQTASGFKRTLSVTGPVNLTNMDEAALRISGPGSTTVQKVG